MTGRWEAGAPLPAVEKEVTPAQVAAYARASGDHNPLHLDEAFARTTPFGRTIAHGMLGLAFLNEALARAFGVAWAASGRLRVRFRAPVYPGERVRTEGAVTRAEARDGATEVECRVALRNARGEEVISGTAWVRLP